MYEISRGVLLMNVLESQADNLLSRAAADVLYEVLTIMVKKGPLSIGGARRTEL